MAVEVTSTHYLLLNDEGRGRIILTTHLTRSEAALLAREVEAYNRYIEVVSKGEAPTTSYTSGWLRDTIYMSQLQFDYEDEHLTHERWQQNCTAWECRLFLVDEEGLAYERGEDGERLRYNDIGTLITSAKDDPLFFLEKYDGKEHSLGYDLLPMTEEAYNRAKKMKSLVRKRVRFAEPEVMSEL